MNIQIYENYEEMSRVAAKIIIKEIQKKPDINLGLATGSTPIGLYKHLIKAHQQQHISFQQIKTFNLDEYVGIPQQHPNSYYSYMKSHLFDQVDINLQNVHIPKTETNQTDRQIQEYNELLETNPIDIQVLGIGSNGHIGFNEPGTSFENSTFIVDLDEQTRKDNARFFSSFDEVPKQAVTMGISNIMNAKKIVLLASGLDKSEAIQLAVYGNVTNELPASILQTHPDCTLILDHQAASQLKKALS